MPAYPHEYQNDWGPVVWAYFFEGHTRYWYECRACTFETRIKKAAAFDPLPHVYCHIPRPIYLSAACLTQMGQLKCRHVDWEALAQCGD